MKAPLLAYTEEKDLHPNYNTSQEVSVEITADNLESAIIQRVVKNKKIERELVNAYEELKEEEIIRYYTDGALAGSSRELESGRMGAGWIVRNKEEIGSNISFSCSIENWPSSTRAELGAIWVVLLTASSRSQVHIFTDSKAAIEAIEKCMGNNKLRSWFKMKNRSLLRQIKDCCIAKSLKLSLHKVKGHSGDKWNDQADLLAKEGIKEINILEILETILGNF